MIASDYYVKESKNRETQKFCNDAKVKPKTDPIVDKK
jgi:hypothetical protein